MFQVNLDYLKWLCLVPVNKLPGCSPVISGFLPSYLLPVSSDDVSDGMVG